MSLEMSHSAPTGEGHLEQGDLVRFLDDEMSQPERAAVAAHLLQCAVCSSSLETMRKDRQLFADMLGQLQLPTLTPARRDLSLSRVETAARRRSFRRSHSGIAAAAAAVVLLSTFALPPVRGFASELLARITNRIEALVTNTTVLEPEPIRVAGATIGFVPEVESFLLEIRSTQREGTVVLGIGDGASVNARAVGGDGAVDISILRNQGMRIENGPSDTGAYAINLPSTLREVRVRIGDNPERVYTIEALRESWLTVIDITPEGTAADHPTP
jgi:anti-sigma factor RsiW